MLLAIGVRSPTQNKYALLHRWSNLTGLVYKDECFRCPAGTYSTSDIITSSDSCIKCWAGYYSSEQGASSSSTCQVCISCVLLCYFCYVFLLTRAFSSGVPQGHVLDGARHHGRQHVHAVPRRHVQRADGAVPAGRLSEMSQRKVFAGHRSHQCWHVRRVRRGHVLRCCGSHSVHAVRQGHLLWSYGPALQQHVHAVPCR